MVCRIFDRLFTLKLLIVVAIVDFDWKDGVGQLTGRQLIPLLPCAVLFLASTLHFHIMPNNSST
jgi:hypothetical protein